MRTVDEKSTIRQRMLLLCDYFNVSPNKLSLDAGLSRNYISRINGVISSDLLRFLYCNYENVSIEWILTGNGNMIEVNNNLNEKIQRIESQLQTLLDNKED